MRAIASRHVFVFALASLLRANSLSIPGSTLSVAAPNRPPFTSLPETRVEFRLHSYTWASGKQILSLGGAQVYFSGPLAQFTASQQLCATNIAGDDMHDYGTVACVDISGRTDVVVRVQRAVTQAPKGEWRLEVWNTTGGGYAATSCASGAPCPIAQIRGIDFHGTAVLNPSPVATGALAWIKWWSSSVPLNSNSPALSDAATLGNWILNNTLADLSSYGLNLSLSQPTFVATPSYPPVCQIGSAGLYSLGVSTLRSTSYPLDGGNTLQYSWKTVSGPTTPNLSNASIASPIVSNLGYGAYTFQLTVTDGSGQSSSCTQTVVSTANYANTTVDANHTPVATILYWLDNINDPLRTSIMNFYGARTNVAIGSNQNMANACKAAGRFCLWPVYVDNSIFTPDAQYAYAPYAAGLGLDMESVLNHGKSDYAIPAYGGAGPCGNLSLGQFDLFDNNGGAGALYGTSKNGVFLLNGATYTDVTVSAYDGSNPQLISDKLLLGYALPFAQVNVTLNAARVGGSVQWQYWNGAWVNLTLASDGTNGLTANGQINFSPPADWKTHSENNSQSKYWIRAVVTGASTNPVYKRVWGDEWVQSPTVFTLNGSTYSDVSFNIHHGFSNTTVSDKLLIGFPSTTVAEIDWKIAAAAGGATVAFQYWNGTSYAALPVIADGSAGLTASGMTYWTVPADWATHAENGITAYWVRVVVTGATANPVVATVWSKTSLRGWSYSDSNRVNQGLGELEYNPTPPAGSSAKFRYQARLGTATWLHNYFLWNHSNQQSGNYSVATLIGHKIIDYATSAAATAVFLDDANAAPNMLAPQTAPFTANTDWTGGLSVLDTQIAVVEAQKTLVKAALGANFAVAANAQIMKYSWHLDGSLGELFAWGYWGGNVRYNLQPDPTALDTSISMDGFLPANNSSGGNGWLVFQDTSWDGGITESDGSWHPWDKGNRGPIAALSGYYMGSNANTTFLYNNRNAYYYETDQFYIRNPINTTLTAAVSADTSTVVKTISVSNSAILAGGTPWVGACGGSPPIGNLALGNQLICLNTIVDSTHIQTTSPIHGSYPAGTPVSAVLEEHQSTDQIPPVSEVRGWGVSFPAMWVNIGTPDPSGWNGGNRDTAWKLGSVITGLSDACQGAGCTNVWRRDFTNAIVLTRPYRHDSPISFANDPRELDVFSQPIALGGTYHPLMADGNTGPAITSIQLRAGEGAILLKTPRLRPAYKSQPYVSIGRNAYPAASSIALDLTAPSDRVSDPGCGTNPCLETVAAPLTGHSLRIRRLGLAGNVVASSDTIPIR